MDKPILFEVKGTIGCITLNRPDKFNSFTRELALDMQAALRTCADDDAIKVIYITGSGRAFCAGQDLGEIVKSDMDFIATIIREHLNPIVRLIRGIEKPVIAAVNGVAAGAGANLAIACDIAVAAQSASFLQAFSKIGLIPDTAGTFFLPRAVGIQKAAAYMMLGEKISAEEAERVGMIYRAYPDETFAESAWALAVRLSEMAPTGLALTKRALNESFNNTLEQQLQVEDDLQNMAGRTPDYAESVRAFLEKRAPVYGQKG